jgi:2-iminobutanoate/2-iminopropanoate deaminase
MQKQSISTPDAPSAPFYSQGIKVGGTIYVSAMAGIDVKTGKVAGPTIQEQTHQALVNCETILHAAGAARENVVDVLVFLARPEDFGGLNEAYSKFFTKDRPTRSVAKLGVEFPNVLVAIRVTAVVPD